MQFIIKIIPFSISKNFHHYPFKLSLVFSINNPSAFKHIFHVSDNSRLLTTIQLIKKILNFCFRHPRIIKELRRSAEKLVNCHTEKVG